MMTKPADPWIATILPTFRALTAERLAELRVLRASAAAAGTGMPSAGALGQIGELVHKIAGTAGTLGFARLDGLAAALEEMCGEFETDDGRWRDNRCALEHLLDALEAELARVIADDTPYPVAASPIKKAE